MYDIGSSPCTCEQEYKSEKDTLKAELAEAQDAAIEIANNQEIRISSLTAERDRLREALQKIVNPKGHMEPDEYFYGACWMQEVAKQALKGESG